MKLGLKTRLLPSAQNNPIWSGVTFARPFSAVLTGLCCRLILVKSLHAPFIQLRCGSSNATAVDLCLASGRILGRLRVHESDRFGALVKRALDFLATSERAASIYSEPERSICKFVATFDKKSSVPWALPWRGLACVERCWNHVERGHHSFEAVLKNEAPSKSTLHKVKALIAFNYLRAAAPSTHCFQLVCCQPFQCFLQH